MSNSPCSLKDISWIPEQVILDDNSSQITYQGPWVAGNAAYSYNWGPSYNSTAHRLNVTNEPSSLSFTFQGTAFSILGNILADPNATTTEELHFYRNCTVDGHNKYNTSVTNLLCGVDDLDDGTHEVKYTISASLDGMFSVNVDAIQYTPTTSELTASHPGVLLVDVCDPSVSYPNVSSWSTYQAPGAISSDPTLGFGSRSRGISTNIYGTQLRYDFVGTKIQALATVLGISDGGSALTHLGWTNFTVDGKTSLTQMPIPQSNVTMYNKLVYESEELSPGRHTLVATYIGNTNNLPLPLSYFVVSSGSTKTSGSQSHLGAILGGVLGGVCGLILFLIVAWVGYARRQRRIEKRAWGITWRNRQHRSDALEMITSPKPEKTAF